MSSKVNSRIAGIHYLTPLQKGILYESIMNRESEQYHVQMVYGIQGDIDTDWFKMAWNLVMIRHEVLRAAFTVKEGNIEKARQIFLWERPLDFAVLEDVTAETLPEIMAADVARGFDLQKDVLLRIRLLHCRDGRKKVMVSFHHIIMDGWCLAIIIGDLKRYYGELRNGTSYEDLCALAKIEAKEQVNFGKYVDTINHIDTGAALKYWENLLHGYENVAEVAPYERLAQSPLQVREYEDEMSAAETAEIVGLANKLEVTVNVVVEAAVGLILQKWCGLTDIVYGKVVSGRNTAGEDWGDVVGLFINSIPIRVETKAEDTVRSVIEAIERQDLESGEYDYCPLFEVQGRSPVGVSLVKFLYAFENYAINEGDGPEAFSLEMEDSREQTNYDLSLTAFLDERLGFRLYYNPSRFSADNGSRFIEILKNILKAMAGNSGLPLSEIAFVTESDHHRIRNEFNRTTVPYDHEMTIVDLFERQVGATPDHIAVVCRQRELTYRELNRQANILARTLRDRGVKVGQYVGIMARRSIEMIIAVIGVMKAGGAYVPIDPAFPEERVAFMLSDCAPVLLLYCGVDSDPAAWPAIPRMDVEMSEYTGGESEENPEKVNTPRDLAYLIYTSGTTGKPKGVMVEHHGVSNLKTYFEKAFHVTAEDRVLQFANSIFDASVWEINMALLNGAALYIVEEETIANPAEFENYVIHHKISIATLPPNYYPQVTKIKPRVLITAGSESTPAIIKEAAGIRYINAYGPTETTVCASHWEYDGTVPTDKIPIGKPISNTQIYIVDGLNLCGVGMPGELCIAGAGVARGYLNREELTKERFIANPFGEGRLYRSGDLARWLPDGNIEYWGRIDEQVKIRGFRIELGEIENAIREVAAVKDCAVTVRAGKGTEKEICAYIVAGEALDMTLVREQLCRFLPEYMIPAWMMQLDKIPVTGSGKVDKRALPAIVRQDTKTYVAPQNKVEKLICEIYQEVLEVEKIGIHDNFFRLGGHSLKAARVLNRLQAEHTAGISIRNIFEHPTPAMLAGFMNKNQITDSTAAETIAPIPRAGNRDIYRASSPQRRMYLLSMADPSGTAYNIPTALGFTGVLDQERLRAALQHMMKRHVILRTAFVMEDGTLCQKPVAEAQPDFACITLEAGQDTSAAVHDLYTQFVRPFAMEKAPLFRVLLVVLGDRQCYLFLDFHHIICDGISIGIFMAELSGLYNGGKLADEVMQYHDYSEWCLGRGDIIAGQRKFWLEQYAGDIPVLELVTDYPRGNRRSFEGRALFLELDRKLSEKIRAICHTYDLTDFMFVLGIAAILLQKYTGQEELIIGTPVSGRLHRDIYNTLGMFSNTLALRLRPEQNLRFREFLHCVRKDVLHALDNQEYSFDELVDELNLHTDTARNPLFDVFVVVQNDENKDLDIEGVQSLSDDREVEYQTAKFDLTIAGFEQDGKYSFMFEYCTALFKEETIRAMMGQFTEIISSIADNQEMAVRDINVVSEAEKEKILHVFNQKEMDMPSTTLLSEELLRIFAGFGDKEALLSENAGMTYAELHQRSAVLAQQLQERGIGAGDCVAVLGGRNFETIVAICGIILTGAAFVPIDPEYPAERIAYICNDCRPAAVLAGGSAEAAGVPAKIPVIVISRDTPSGAETPIIKSSAVHTDTAYIIYTSGTTGRPKGVMLDHTGLLNLQKHHRQVYDISAKDVVLKFANIVFDASIWEITLALLNGAALFIAGDETIKNEIALARELESKRVTIAAFPPNYVSQLETATLRGLRVLVTGGSAAGREIAARFGTNSLYVNEYGPTEITVSATYWKYQNGDYLPEKLPIGRPVINKKIYILHDTQLCGIGMTGELCIAGIGTAQGYMNNEELTKAKFTDNPFGTGPLYRTGDLARWLPDGNIEYLGRMDQQVKIRGYRIELEEIENVVRSLPGITDAAAVIGPDALGEPAIYGYFTADEPLAHSRIRSMMRQVVPEYMIPALLMQIERIPVTPSGKIDRRALPAMAVTEPEQNEYVAPETAEEIKVYQCFVKIFNSKKIGIYDDFFALGGHSLRAMRLIHELAESFGIEIPMRTLYQYPTIAGLAGQCTGRQAPSVTIPAAAPKEHYLMSPAERRMFMIDRIDDTGIAYNMPQALAVKGKPDLTRLNEAFREIVRRHEIFRTGFGIVGELPVQKIMPAVSVSVEQYYGGETDVPGLFQEFVRPFDLDCPPLVRLAVVMIDETKGYLFFDAHHIVCDGGSIGVFWDELTRLYGSQSLDRPELQYKDYSEWLLTRADALNIQKEYWLGQYRDGIPATDIPLDHPRPQMQQFTGSSIMVSTAPGFKAEMEKLARKAGVTEFVILLSALYILLHKYGRSDDIAVGTVVSGRKYRGTEKMIGMFANTIALRARPAASKGCREFLEEVARICLDGFENQEFSFEELVDSVVTERNMSRNPIFDVMLVLQHNEDDEAGESGETAGITELDMEDAAFARSHAAKFDLTFNISQNDGYVIMVEYCTALFEQETVQNMARHYLLILERILAEPERQIGSLTVCTDREATKIKDQFNDTAAFYPPDKTMHEMFEEQAGRYPDKTAVICEEQRITYRQLNQQANQLADKLIGLGIGRNDYVVIMAENSIDTLSALLAVQKSGAAYVPVDAAYPAERIRYIMADCHPQLVLYDSPLTVQDVFDGIETMHIRAGFHSAAPVSNPRVKMSVEDAAYVIYTSGTTGQPKGVRVPHRGIANLRQYFWDVQKISDRDVTLQFAKMVFDAAISELCMGILSGGTMCIITPRIRDDLRLFNQYIRECQVTAAVLPVLYAATADVSSLTTLITAGSAANHDFVRQSAGRQRYSNDYGPTETTVCATHWEPEGNRSIPERVPIGKPIHNTQVYLMEQDHLCGIGVPGELCIAGIGVADGYLNQEELTAAKFIDNPFGSGRLYRSGDLARWLPDGNIDYLGRIDDQVKLRGFRIELGEIEHVIQKQSGVTGACVIVRQEMLLAYYTTDPADDWADGAVTGEELTQVLARELPAYMLPQRIMHLEALPVNQSGKIDKKALPDIPTDQTEGYLAPVTDDEIMLADIFAEVLNVARIGVTDDFFEKGGDSIKAIRIAAKVAEQGRKIGVKEIMAARNIAALAGRLTVLSENRTYQERFAGQIRPLPIQRDFIESWHFEQPGHFCQAMMLWKAKIDMEVLSDALTVLVDHHDMLRARYREGIIEVPDHAAAGFRIEEWDIRPVPDKERAVAEYGTALMAAMDIETGPIVKAAVYHDEGCDHILIAVHHLAVDAVSWSIILEDFTKAYQQAEAKMTIKLPPKSAPFAAWAEALYRYEQSPEFAECRQYWQQIAPRLAEYDLNLHTPTDTCGERRKETVTLELGKTLSDHLLYDCGAVYKTEMEDLLLTAFISAYHELTGQAGLALMIEGHGRDELPHMPDITRTVGWFTVVYPVLLTYEQEREKCLLGVKEQLRTSKKYQLGYGLWKYLAQGTDDLHISFNYLGDLGGGSEDDWPDSTFSQSQLPVGQAISDHNNFNHLMAINAFLDKTLSFTFTYETGGGLQDFINHLTGRFEQNLQETADFIMGQENRYQTLSDIDQNIDLDDSMLEGLNEMAGSIL